MRERLLSTRQVCRATGATPRQLRYWVKSDLVMPSVRSQGAGSWNLWSDDSVDNVHEVMAMLRNGMTLQAVRMHRESEPVMKVTYSTSQIASLDKLAGDIVRSRGICYRCGVACALQWAHIRRRRFMATRWDLDNALALCQSCHDWADRSPKNMASLIGESRYDALRARSLESATRSTAEIRKSLRTAAMA